MFLVIANTENEFVFSTQSTVVLGNCFEEKKIKPFSNFTRYDWNRMSRLCDQFFRDTDIKLFLLRILDILKIVFDFLFLFKRGRWWFHWWS